MAKRVKFHNTSGQTLYVELGEKNNFVDGTPECFDNDWDGHAELAVIDVYGMFFPNGDTTGKPFMYFRHTDVEHQKYRFGNLVELGDDWLSPQKGVFHADEVADSDTLVSKYGKISDDPIVYGFGSDSKILEARFYDKYFTMNEANAFKIKAEPWKYTVYEHQSLYAGSSLILQPSTFIGTFDGKPVIGLGSYDRMCISRNVNGFDNIIMEYVAMNAMGIRDDGRKEMVLISAAFNGKIVVYYLLEGEEPIITDHVEIEAEWKHLPYVDDGTCVFKDAVFYFCGKEIHFEGKWGTKGFLKEPRIEKHGQSQVFGTWYEGKTPYKHRVYYTFVENMGAFDYKLKELGFDVVD